ncbi:MAG: citrate/2-methylcitrate synthase [Clostridia bacterium]|nr:citrate/2-methylcitrate synthase [Clostridia bacterium]
MSEFAYINDLAKRCVEHSNIDPALYTQYDVKRGLRDANGKGVLTGLTDISSVHGTKEEKGSKEYCEGQLRYRGVDINDLTEGVVSEHRYGFEETVYLLLIGKLPTAAELKSFSELLASYRSLPDGFVRDIIMHAPSKDLMNLLARSVLTLYSYDLSANDISIPNVMAQCLHLISALPMITIYAYHSYNHFIMGHSLYINQPSKNRSMAENILLMLRRDKKYTELEARLLDLALILHAEHGGGNNSTFTNHVVTSSGTDTYSAMAASLCSLKGPRHGGANIKVVGMFADIMSHVSDWKNGDEVAAYLEKILNKEAFDRSGLIYGIGHAIYTKSDPRALIFKKYVAKLAAEKGRTEEFELYTLVEKLAPGLIAARTGGEKPICANIDFYSGFAYSMLSLPEELFTPIFAIARIAGWSAHRIEELINNGKIIRPAYMAVQPDIEYVPLMYRK